MGVGRFLWGLVGFCGGWQVFVGVGRFLLFGRQK